MYNLLWDTWQRNGPPVYMAVAGYLGLMNDKVKVGKKPSEPEEKGDLFDLLGMAGPGGIFN